MAYIWPAMSDATSIRQIELQLYKAERGFGALAAKPPPRDFFRQVAVNYRQLAAIASKPEIKQRMLDMAATYQAKADEDYERELPGPKMDDN